MESNTPTTTGTSKFLVKSSFSDFEPFLILTFYYSLAAQTIIFTIIFNDRQMQSRYSDAIHRQMNKTYNAAGTHGIIDVDEHL
ncbi:hypothetical protein [Mastigocladopsis repens]|uniref:hypothetical protein n=1 Tax=Mastigocladopsis repens TaxID=221287 RepID=UPI0002EBA4A9|nr:hypothetical protein [Mastigocladopsis repens]